MPRSPGGRQFRQGGAGPGAGPGSFEDPARTRGGLRAYVATATTLGRDFRAAAREAETNAQRRSAVRKFERYEAFLRKHGGEPTEFERKEALRLRGEISQREYARKPRPIVVNDERTGLRYEWSGRAHLVNVYRGEQAVDAFTVGDQANNNASPAEVRRGIQRRQRGG